MGRATPLGPFLLICAWIGRLAQYFISREREIACVQIDYARNWLKTRRPDPREIDISKRHASLASADNILKFSSSAQMFSAVMAHIGTTAGEALNVPKFLPSSPPRLPHERLSAIGRVDSIGQERVYEIISSGKGAIALSGHIGCFELLAAFHIQTGVPLSVVGRKPNYEWLADALTIVRDDYEVDTLWREDSTSARKFVEAIKAGTVVAALIDQDTKLDNGFAPFFGIPAAHPITAIRLAIRFKVPILSSFIVRTGKFRHTVITSEIRYDPADLNAEQSVLEEFSLTLQDLVCRYPEQWLWWHRRWRRRPQINYNQFKTLLRSTPDYLEWLKQGAIDDPVPNMTSADAEG